MPLMQYPPTIRAKKKKKKSIQKFKDDLQLKKALIDVRSRTYKKAVKGGKVVDDSKLESIRRSFRANKGRG